MSLDVGRMSSICVQFWYYLYGSTIDTLRLNVTNETDNIEVWSLSGDQGERWHLLQKEIAIFGSPVKLQVEGVYGKGLDSDISLDDFAIYEGSCAGSKNDT